MERRTKSLGIERESRSGEFPALGFRQALSSTRARLFSRNDDPARRERGGIVSYIQVYKDGAAVAGN